MRNWALRGAQVNTELVRAAGGLGLFLLGMVILTEGLRGLAGDALQRTMRRFTSNPVSGALTGMGITAMIQSSSATTVAAVGFAGAGLLTFPEALGLVFGANVGTTMTGWAVALLGFKLDLSLILPPFILIGALLRLVGNDRIAALGYALAGFGLVFLGIDLLSAGLGSLETGLSFEGFSADTIAGRLLLVGIGVVVTVLTQSSSAGVATALAAVHTQTIGFTQACAVVIGMDVGTTVSTVVAAIGGTVAARRTAWAHVVLNILTAIGAFVLLPIYVFGLDTFAPDFLEHEPEIGLVAFHTLFNLLGLIAVLPVAGSFARVLERIVPERPLRWTERLDPSLVRDPAVALRAVAPTLGELALQTFDLLREGLAGRPPDEERRTLLLAAIDQTRDYLAKIETPSRGGDTDARELAALHLIDQLRRLNSRLGQRNRQAVLARDVTLSQYARGLRDALRGPLETLPVDSLVDSERAIGSRRDEFRRQIFEQAARDDIDSPEAIARLDAWRWLQRSMHHVVRILHYMEQVQLDRPATTRRDREQAEDAEEASPIISED